MQAIFMQEINGRLEEVERREIKPTTQYKKAILSPISASKETRIDEVVHYETEIWVMVSSPLGDRGFAIFILDHAGLYGQDAHLLT